MLESYVRYWPFPWSPQGTSGTMTPDLCTKYDQKAWGVLPEKLGRGWRHASWNPYPISDQNLLFSLPYFRPEALEPGAWAERVTSCYGTNTDGVNIKREMVLTPNDEEVAPSKEHAQFKTSLTNHTLFQTKMAKLIPYFWPKRLKNIPFSAAHTYIAYTREYPQGRKTCCRFG